LISACSVVVPFDTFAEVFCALACEAARSKLATVATPRTVRFAPMA
jgi:hypothetical protein